MSSRAWPEMALSEKELRSRRRRNVALGLVLGGFIVLIYVVSIVKMGG
jgi:hypothetical protein